MLTQEKNNKHCDHLFKKDTQMCKLQNINNVILKMAPLSNGDCISRVKRKISYPMTKMKTVKQRQKVTGTLHIIYNQSAGHKFVLEQFCWAFYVAYNITFQFLRISQPKI